jgi:hypothetical protein
MKLAPSSLHDDLTLSFSKATGLPIVTRWEAADLRPQRSQQPQRAAVASARFTRDCTLTDGVVGLAYLCSPWRRPSTGSDQIGSPAVCIALREFLSPRVSELAAQELADFRRLRAAPRQREPKGDDVRHLVSRAAIGK